MSTMTSSERLAALLKTQERPVPATITFPGSQKYTPPTFLNQETGLPEYGQAPTDLISEFSASRLQSGFGMGGEIGSKYWTGIPVRTGTGVYADTTLDQYFATRQERISSWTEEERAANGMTGYGQKYEDGLPFWKANYTQGEREMTGWDDETVKAMGGPQKVAGQFQMFVMDKLANQTLEAPEIADEGWTRWLLTGSAGLVTELLGDPTTYATLGVGVLTKAGLKGAASRTAALGVSKLPKSGALQALAGKLVTTEAALESSKLAKAFDAMHLGDILVGSVGQNIIQARGQHEWAKQIRVRLGQAEAEYADGDLPDALGMAGLMGLGFTAATVGTGWVYTKLRNRMKSSIPESLGVPSAGPIVPKSRDAVSHTADKITAGVYGGSIGLHMKRIHGDEQALITLWGDREKWDRWTSVLGVDNPALDPINLIKLLQKNASIDEIQAWHDDIELRVAIQEEATAKGRTPVSGTGMISRLWEKAKKRAVYGRIPVEMFPVNKPFEAPLTGDASVRVNKNINATMSFDGGFPVFNDDPSIPKWKVVGPTGVEVEVAPHVMIDAGDTTKALYLLGSTSLDAKRNLAIWDYVREAFPELDDREIAGLAAETRRRAKLEIDDRLAQAEPGGLVYQIPDVWRGIFTRADRDASGVKIRTREEWAAAVESSTERQRYHAEVTARHGDTAAGELKIMDAMVIAVARATDQSIDDVYSRYTAVVPEELPTGNAPDPVAPESVIDLKRAQEKLNDPRTHARERKRLQELVDSQAPKAAAVKKAIESGNPKNFVRTSAEAYLSMLGDIDPELLKRISKEMGWERTTQFTPEMLKKWVDSYEQYRMMHGTNKTGPRSNLHNIFRDFTAFVAEVYRAIVQSRGELSDGMVKLMDDIFSMNDRDIQDLSKRRKIPFNIRNPQTRFNTALEALKEAHGMRNAALNRGITDAASLNALDRDVKKASAAFEAINTSESPKPDRNYNPNTDLQRQVGVIPRAERGAHLTTEEAVLVLKDSPILRSTDGRAFLGGSLIGNAMRQVNKLGNKFRSTGRFEILANAVPAIRMLGTMIASTGPSAKAIAGVFEKGYMTLESARHFVAQRSGSVKSKYRDLIKKHGWSATDETTLMRNVMLALTDNEVDKLGPQEKELWNLLSPYLDQWGTDAVEAGVIKTLEDNYYPIVLLKSEQHRAAEVIDVIWDNWMARFTAEDAPLHMKTLKQLGWIEKKPDGSWGRRTDILPDPTRGTPSGGTAANMSLLDDLDKITSDPLSALPQDNPFASLSDLPTTPPVPGAKSLRDLYLEALGDRTVGGDKRPIRGLLREAWVATHRAFGREEMDVFVPDTVNGAHVNRAASRKIERSVWMDPRLSEFIDYQFENIVDEYGESLGITTKQQEITNALVRDMTGQDRRDITMTTLIDAMHAELLIDTPRGEAQRAIDEAFSFIKGKVAFARSGGIATDPARDMGYQHALATIAINLSQSAVAGRNPLQQMAVEWTTIMANAVMRGGVTGMKDFIVGLLQGASKDDLVGLYHYTEQFRTHANRVVYDIDHDNSIVRSWSDAAIKNPIKRIKEAATNPQTSGMRRVGDVAMAFTNGLAQLSRGLTFESFIMQQTQEAVARVEIAASARTYNKGSWDRLSAALVEAQADLLTMSQKDAEKKFRGMTRAAGFGGDHNLAVRLMTAGLLNPVHVQAFKTIKELGGGDLFTKDGRINWDVAHEAVMSSIGRDDRQTIKETIGRLKMFLEAEVDARATRPGALDLYTPTGGATPPDRLAMAFTSFSRAWFNKTMMERLGNDKLHAAVGLLGLTLIAEVTYNTLNRILYDGTTVSGEMKEWEDNPGSRFFDTMARTNFLGSANSVTRVAAGILSELRFSTQPSYPETVSFRALSAGAKILTSFRDDVEVTSRDAKAINSIIPGLNHWVMQAIARATGYKGVAGWMTGEVAK